MSLDRPVIVIGGGSHAKDVIEALKLCSVKLIGATDPDPKLEGIKILGVDVLGGDDLVFKHHVDSVLLANGVGSLINVTSRRAVFEKFKKRGYRFTNVIHPAAIISEGVDFGEGVQVMAGAIVQSGVILGDDVLVNVRACVGHDSKVGAHAHIATMSLVSGGVIVGDNVFVGAGAIVIQGFHIGAAAMIGAGAIVNKNVEPGSKIIGSRLWALSQ